MAFLKNTPKLDLLGQMLANYRHRAKLTQAGAALLTGFAPSTIAQWEKQHKRPQPWTLDVLCYAYALNEYESFLLFYEAGYAPFAIPPELLMLLRSYSNVPIEWRDAANGMLNSTTGVLDAWLAHTRSLGLETPKRHVPSAGEVARYWDDQRADRYHSRRVDPGNGTDQGDGDSGGES